MKTIKLICATALALLTMTALASPSSAIAETTALCSFPPGALDIEYLFPFGFHILGELPEVCEKVDTVTHVHEATLEGKKAALKTSLLTVECDVLFLGDALSGLVEGGPVTIHGNFTYTNCGNCTVTEENGPAEVKVLKEGHETGSVTGEGLVHVTCSGLNCRYNGVGQKGTAKGPLLATETNGEVTLTEQSTNKESGLFCPNTSKLTITTTPLSATYIGL